MNCETICNARKNHDKSYNHSCRKLPEKHLYVFLDKSRELGAIILEISPDKIRSLRDSRRKQSMKGYF